MRSAPPVGVAEAGAHTLARDDSNSISEPLSQELKGIRVVAVDDDPEARRLIECVLTNAKATAKVVSNAQDALEAVQKLQPHVLLSDIEMPGEDSYGSRIHPSPISIYFGGRLNLGAPALLTRPESV